MGECVRDVCVCVCLHTQACFSSGFSIVRFERERNRKKSPLGKRTKECSLHWAGIEVCVSFKMTNQQIPLQLCCIKVNVPFIPGFGQFAWTYSQESPLCKTPITAKSSESHFMAIRLVFRTCVKCTTALKGAYLGS